MCFILSQKLLCENSSSFKTVICDHERLIVSFSLLQLLKLFNFCHLHPHISLVFFLYYSLFSSKCLFYNFLNLFLLYWEICIKLVIISCVYSFIEKHCWISSMFTHILDYLGPVALNCFEIRIIVANPLFFRFRFSLDIFHEFIEI